MLDERWFVNDWSQWVITLAAGFGGVALGQWGALWLASRNDRRHLRDLKRERLGRLYAPLVDYALFLEKVAGEQSYVLEGETTDQRDKRLQQRSDELRPGLLEVQRYLHIEPGTTAVVDSFLGAIQVWGDYMRLLALPGHGGQITAEQVHAKAEELGRAARRLQDTARKQLEELEKPL